MSVSTLAHPPRHAPSLVAFWLAILFLIAVGVALAWWATSGMRGETLPSGLVIRTSQAGSGDPIGLQDGVLIEYEGRLEDGTVFDSSAGRGPAPMIVGQTIPGFAEALTHMKKGGTYSVHIPSDLAYGPTPPPGIPPNANLEFDVHVVQVVPDAGLQMSAPQPQPAQPGGNQPSE